MDNKPVPWYETLDDVTREKVFAVMRAIDADSERYYAEARRLAPRYYEVSVGSADTDAAMSAEARRSFLSYLRRGLSPADASERAKADCKALVEKNNAARADYMARRWVDGHDTCIDGLRSRIDGVLS